MVPPASPPLPASAPPRRVAFVCPALNEEGAIGDVVTDFLRAAREEGWVGVFVVGDNGSLDRTGAVAEAAGACVVVAPRRGYGAACLAALAHPAARAAEIIVFVDGDGACDPADLPALLRPFLDPGATGLAMVLGTRVPSARHPRASLFQPTRRRAKETAEKGALTRGQRTGSVVAAVGFRLLYGVDVSDLGPFRALPRLVLDDLAMDDQNFGWTVQMQARLARRRLPVLEVPVAWRRRRTGVSKVSGDLQASIQAARIILRVLVVERFRSPTST